MNETKLQASVDIEIPFYDVDLMEIVWHGHYAKYFEIARCALLDKIGYNYIQMRDSGYAWPIIDLNIRYMQPARFGQFVNVDAKIVEWEHRLKIHYLITDKATGTRLSKGYTVQVAVKMPDNSMCLVSPDVLLEKLGIR